MAEKKQKRGLGRGLSALLDDVSAASGTSGDQKIAGERDCPLDLIRPNPDQPRRDFPPREMEDLTNSIREKGVLQPLLVRPDPDDSNRYQIIAGERRWRAAQAARLHSVPIVVREFTDLEMLEVAIIENVQRADLNPVEEALGYQQLIDRFGHSQAKLADAMGKSRSHIANTLRLLSLPEDVRDHLAAGRLSAGHARALITADNPSQLARDVLAKGLSVRQTEALAKHVAHPAAGKQPIKPKKDADTRALESDLSAALGLSVSIDHKGQGGTLRITYKDLEELDGICQLLSV
ncbi:MAG: ParB/RepB/Spo0J family partition protein [Pikeienuella sp.]